MAEERLIVVPFKTIYAKPPRIERAKRAVKFLRAFVARHAKVPQESVRIAGEVSAEIFGNGMKKPPRRIKVMLSKDKGIVRVDSTAVKKDNAGPVKAKAAAPAAGAKKMGDGEPAESDMEKAGIDAPSAGAKKATAENSG